MSTGHTNSSEIGRGDGAQAPPAPGAEPLSPRQVIRGESSDENENSACTDSAGFGAFTDYLNVTFRLPEWSDVPGGVYLRLTGALAGAFGFMECLGRGLHGYGTGYRFERGGVRFALGGQANTGLLSIPGGGCALVPDWPRLVELLQVELKARITRWDGAVDDYLGDHSVNDAVELYLSGAFNAGGRRPCCDQKGNWIAPDGSGRTFYVGKRKNGKLLRVYEKGCQLGDPNSPWTRWEVELHNVDRVIPWDVIANPAPYVTGAYPALSWVSGFGSRIPTLRRTDSISYQRIIHCARLAYGRLVETMLAREESAEVVVRRLRRPGVPERLAITEALGIRGDG